MTASEASDGDWKEAWKSYREANKGKKLNEDTWKLDGWTVPQSVINNQDPASNSLISTCSINKDKEVSGKDDPLYKEVLAYCTRATLVSDLISDNYPNKKILPNSSDEEGWKAAWGRYKTDNTGKSTKNSDTWQLSDWPTSNLDSVPESFKTECGKRIKVATFKTDNGDYLNAVKWCTN